KQSRDRRSPSFEDAPAAPAPSPAPVEPVAAGPKVADWSAMPPPPVRRRDDAPVATEAPKAPGGAAADEVLAWMMGGSGAIPAAKVPERTDGGDADAGGVVVEDAAVVTPTLAEPSYPLFPEYHAKRSKMPQIIVITLIVLVVLGGGGFFFYSMKRKAGLEVERRDEAAKLLKDRNFDVAERKYEDLAKNYGKSSDAPKYRFSKDYARASAAALETGSAPPEKRREEFSKYLTSIRNGTEAQKEWLNEQQRPTWETLQRLADDQARDVEKKVAEKKFED